MTDHYQCQECFEVHHWDELNGPKDGDENLEDLECPCCGGKVEYAT